MNEVRSQQKKRGPNNSRSQTIQLTRPFNNDMMSKQNKKMLTENEAKEKDEPNLRQQLYKMNILRSCK